MEHGTEADLIVIGAGWRGRAAALAAAREGARVVLLDDGPLPHLPGIELRPGRIVWTATPGFTVEAIGPHGRETYRAPRLVSAIGALPRLLPFPGWTLPGVGALGDRTRGRRIVLAGSGPRLAREAARLGPRVVAVIDLADNEIIAAARGRTRVERVTIIGAPLPPLGEGRGGDVACPTAPSSQRPRHIAADTILMGYGTMPRPSLGALLHHPPGLQEHLPPDPCLPWRHLVRHIAPGTPVCPCEDLTRADLEAAIAEGAADMNQLRAFTRCGMGACQGRLCGPAASALVPGRWTVRPPLRPIPLAALLGRFTYADIPVPPPAPP